MQRTHFAEKWRCSINWHLHVQVFGPVLKIMRIGGRSHSFKEAVKNL